MASRVDSSKYRRKMKRLKMLPGLAVKFVEDAVAYFLQKILDETLAGAPGTMPVAAPGSPTVVGVQSGMLRRSFLDITRDGLRWTIASNTAIAPYAGAVAEKVRSRHGRDYLRTTKHFHEPTLMAKWRAFLKKFAADLAADRDPRYANPFT